MSPLESIDDQIRLDHDYFDAVICGTGFEHCILAGALACAGKSVLHIDSNNYYGDECATLPWRHALQALHRQYEDVSVTTGGDHLSDKFLIDLQPGLLFARSDLVDDMIQSGTHHYVTFRSINSHFTILDDRIVQVPISKPAIFQCPYMSRPDKRRLMKLLHVALNDDRLSTAPSNAIDLRQLELFENRPFMEYLDELQLSVTTKDIIVYSLCLADNPNISTASGMRALRKFVNSLGRFDLGAFMYPVYGTGDFPQAFARLAAIYGTTYLLRTSGSVQESDSSVLLSTSQRVTCALFVGKQPNVDGKTQSEQQDRLSRCVCVCTRPIESTESLALLVIPPGIFKNAIKVLQVDNSTGCVPKGSFILYLSSLQADSPQSDLAPILDWLMPQDYRLATVYFTECHRPASDFTSKLLRQIDFGRTNFNVDLDIKAAAVRSVFQNLFQGLVFLKRESDEGTVTDLDGMYNPDFDNIISNTESLSL